MKTTHIERQWAQLVAKLMRNYNETWKKAARAKGSESEWERFHDHMGDCQSNIFLFISMINGHSNANLPRTLRLIADALDGKLRGTNNEEAVLMACERAMKRRSEKRRLEGRRGWRISDFSADPRDVQDLLPVVCTQMGLKKAPHRDHVRRILKKLGKRSRA
jgi:hypothetical protein